VRRLYDQDSNQTVTLHRDQWRVKDIPMDRDKYTTRRRGVPSRRAKICLSQSDLTAFPTTSHSEWIPAVHQQALLINAHSHRDPTRQAVQL
jgi:hypothetical protein